MTLSPEDQEIIEEEQEILTGVLESLRAQREILYGRLSRENTRSRELTAGLVAASRDEDKAMLASDEAVSYAMRDNIDRDVKQLDSLIKNPYFARIVVAEGEKELEYKIGFLSNSDTRIVDWRKAPISKLYYEYREGEEYSELIQSRERNGTIIKRHSLDVTDGKLSRVSCPRGNFLLKDGQWTKTESTRSRAGSTDRGELPHILSLITPEQFALITTEASSAVLIQGIAGSGKTTVALHRLAWLLHEENMNLNPAECIVVVRSNTLKTYISKTLPSMNIEGVEVLTFREWAVRTIKVVTPQFVTDQKNINRPATPTPSSIERIKSSMAMLQSLEELVQSGATDTADYTEIVLSVLSNHKKIIENDETSLIDKELIEAARQHTIQNFNNKVLDPSDDALFLRICELKEGSLYHKDGRAKKYSHIAVDEVQDFSPIELSSFIGSVKDLNELTLVGDTSQKIDESNVFPGWEKLKRYWNFKEDISHYITLTISHRSTRPIMRLASHIQGQQIKPTGRPGKAPIWFQCRTESQGIGSAIQWLTTALKRFPNEITAVICRTPAEAREVLGLLKPAFGSVIRAGDEQSFSFEEGIVVTDVKEVKGLEFFNVLIWNPTDKSYPSGDLNRNLLYVSATRAEENLCLITWGRPSPYLPSTHSSIVRGIDV